jgi:hypothetical protein
MDFAIAMKINNMRLHSRKQVTISLCFTSISIHMGDYGSFKEIYFHVWKPVSDNHLFLDSTAGRNVTLRIEKF